MTPKFPPLMLPRNYTCHIEIFIPVSSLHMTLQFLLLCSRETTLVTIMTSILMNRFIMIPKSPPLCTCHNYPPNKDSTILISNNNNKYVMFRAHVIFIRGMVTYTFQPTF